MVGGGNFRHVGKGRIRFRKTQNGCPRDAKHREDQSGFVTTLTNNLLPKSVRESRQRRCTNDQMSTYYEGCGDNVERIDEPHLVRIATAEEQTSGD